VTLNVRPIIVNTCPVATGTNVSVNAGSSLSFNLNAGDIDGDPLQFSITQAPAHGIVVVQVATGAATYTPAAGYTGPDSFKFKANDGHCDSQEATVNINVLPTGNTAPHAQITASPLVDFSPAVANKVLISCNGSNACLLLDGSLSSDAESPLSQLTFHWSIVPLLPFATGVTVTECFELGTPTILLTVTDPGGLSGTDSLTIDVVSAGESIGLLIEKINSSVVARKNKRPFIATLKAAAASADRGQTHTAANQLHALQNKIRAQIAPSNPADAALWTRWAQNIIDALNACE
jgi:hypothetical protein